MYTRRDSLTAPGVSDPQGPACCGGIVPAPHTSSSCEGPAGVLPTSTPVEHAFAEGKERRRTFHRSWDEEDGDVDWSHGLSHILRAQGQQVAILCRLLGDRLDAVEEGRREAREEAATLRKRLRTANSELAALEKENRRLRGLLDGAEVPAPPAAAVRTVGASAPVHTGGEGDSGKGTLGLSEEEDVSGGSGFGLLDRDAPPTDKMRSWSWACIAKRRRRRSVEDYAPPRKEEEEKKEDLPPGKEEEEEEEEDEEEDLPPFPESPGPVTPPGEVPWTRVLGRSEKRRRERKEEEEKKEEEKEEDLPHREAKGGLLRCYRCLRVGHVRRRCTAKEDRGDRCYRCAEPGHLAKECTASVIRCPLCADLGRRGDHRLGAAACEPPPGGGTGGGRTRGDGGASAPTPRPTHQGKGSGGEISSPPLQVDGSAAVRACPSVRTEAQMGHEERVSDAEWAKFLRKLERPIWPGWGGGPASPTASEGARVVQRQRRRDVAKVDCPGSPRACYQGEPEAKSGGHRRVPPPRRPGGRRAGGRPPRSPS